MGNPLSVLLADLFLYHLEINKILIDNTVGIIIPWHRYIDDILTIMNYNLDKTNLTILTVLSAVLIIHIKVTVKFKANTTLRPCHYSFG